ncbi:SCO1664 family protein [Brevibacterium yomogidense]|uniref:SCO1664 family protein n=1 Tax=Brevibacterium yomogidense TaxID=946573 RepID=UPI0018DF2EB9|nr:SCO1664 family protein [Brevibacterium yomogidense]
MLRLLATGTVRPLGRMRGASNETLLATVTGAECDGGPERTVRAVFKTRAGERPLRDFPAGTLSQREVAAYRLAAHLGLGLIPPTVWREDLGSGGSVQAYVETDPFAPDPVVLVGESAIDADLAPVLRAVLDDGSDVVLAHSLSSDMRTLALLDVLLNNADRKGGHVLAGAWRVDGALPPTVGVHAIDNGLSFHPAPKLRTILWGFAGQPLTHDEQRLVARVRDTDLTQLFEGLLAEHEVESLTGRAVALLSAGTFPLPDEDRHIVPWPPL